MISIRNSLDMTRTERKKALREVLALGFCPGGGAGAAAMLANKMAVEEIKNTAFPHPTVSEAIREAVFR